MAKHYMFYRKDIINLLLNHKRYISLKAQELIAQGRDLSMVTFGETRKWTEEFFDEEIAQGEVKLEHILDDVDEVLKTTHGKSTRELAEEWSNKN